MRRSLGVVAILLAAAVVTGCASTKPAPLVFSPGAIDPNRVVAKVDEFVLVVDASTSMSEPRNARRKLDVARDLSAGLSATVPELDYLGGVRTLGQAGCLPDGPTSLIYGMTTYSRSAAAAAVDRIRCAGGGTPLSKALDGAAADLAPPAGALGENQSRVPATALPPSPTAAVIVVSDGLHLGKDEIAAARRLKSAWGDRLCLWAIQVGDDDKGRDMLQKIVDVGGCGRLASAAELTNPAKLEVLVRDALLYPDSDGDKVPDHLDKCPDTPQGVAVDANGCPPDSDGDGVPDYLDKCPDTPRGVKVDANGCPPPPPPKPSWSTPGDVLFDFDRATIRKDAKPVLDEIATRLAGDPSLSLNIEGHTDSIGSEEYNLKLSARRAEAVKGYLVSKGIDGGRLTTTGLGESKPVAPNDNRANRQLNRRVEFKPKG